MPGVEIEPVGLDNDLGKTLNTIFRGARTGERGDGKISVLPANNAVHA